MTLARFPNARRAADAFADEHGPSAYEARVVRDGGRLVFVATYTFGDGEARLRITPEQEARPRAIVEAFNDLARRTEPIRDLILV
jgi:adenosyl cobinamide kinase/adenosyl cobinamide phosphate guanylyltransferase